MPSLSNNNEQYSNAYRLSQYMYFPLRSESSFFLDFLLLILNHPLLNFPEIYCPSRKKLIKINLFVTCNWLTVSTWFILLCFAYVSWRELLKNWQSLTHIFRQPFYIFKIQNRWNWTFTENTNLRIIRKELFQLQSAYFFQIPKVY